MINNVNEKINKNIEAVKTVKNTLETIENVERPKVDVELVPKKHEIDIKKNIVRNKRERF